MLVKYCFWTTGKYQMWSVIHVLLRWNTNFLLASMELCRTFVRKSSIWSLRLCSGARYSKFWQKLPNCSACYYNFGGLEVLLGAISPQKSPLLATGMELCSGTNMSFDIIRNDKRLHIIQMYDFSRLHMQWRNWQGEEGRITRPGKLHVKTGRAISLYFVFSIPLVFSRLLALLFFLRFSEYVLVI